MLGELTGLLAGLAAFVGFVLLWLGIRGRKVDDHPICKRCGRDLSDQPAVPDLCPHCRRELTPENLIHGHRQRRGGLIGGGILLIVSGLLVLGLVLILGAAGTAVDPYKPVWLLSMEAGSSDSASAELARRVRQGKLSRDEIQSLTSRFLSDQADQSHPWQAEKGNFIESAYRFGALSPDQWEQYVQQGLSAGLTPRPVISAGKQLPIEVKAAQIRLGTPTAMSATEVPSAQEPGSLPIRLLIYARDAEGQPYVTGSGMVNAAAAVQMAIDYTYLDITGPQRALRGNQEAELTLAIAGHYEVEAPALSTRTWTAPVKLVATSDQSVTVRNDPQILDSLRKGVEVLSLEIEPPDWWRVALEGGTHDRYDPPRTATAHLNIRVPGQRNAPPLCYRIFIDDRGTEHEITRFVRYTGGVRTAYTQTLDGFDTLRRDRVRVILRPDPQTAEETVDILEICGGDIVVEDVPVTYPDWYIPHRQRLAGSTGQGQ